MKCPEQANPGTRTEPEVARLGHGEDKGLRGMRTLVFLFGTRKRSEMYYGDGCATQSTSKGTELCALNRWINEMSDMVKFYLFFLN